MRHADHATCCECIHEAATPQLRVIVQDSTLNNIFSTVYGFVVIESGLFLATCSLRVLKREDERFRKIDEKRGTKGGFV